MGKQKKPPTNQPSRKASRKKKSAKKAAGARGSASRSSKRKPRPDDDPPPKFQGVDDSRNKTHDDDTNIFKRKELAQLRALVERGYQIPDAAMRYIPAKLLKEIRKASGRDLSSLLRTLASFERLNVDKMNVLAKLDLMNKEGNLGDKDDLEALRLSMQIDCQVVAEPECDE